MQGERYTLSQQVLNFETNTLNQLRTMMGASNLTDYLAKSIAILAFGSNDYINNYLMPTYPSQFTYTPPQFAYLLLNRYARQLLVSQLIKELMSDIIFKNCCNEFVAGTV